MALTPERLMPTGLLRGGILEKLLQSGHLPGKAVQALRRTCKTLQAGVRVNMPLSFTYTLGLRWPRSGVPDQAPEVQLNNGCTKVALLTQQLQLACARCRL